MSKVKIHSISPALHAEKENWQQYLIHPLRIFFGDGSPEWSQYKPAFSFYLELYEYTAAPQSADIHVLPFAINYYYRFKKLGLAKEAYQQAEESGKPFLIWIEGDFDLLSHFPNAIYLKNASFRSRQHTNEIIRAGDVRQDLLHQYYKGQLSIRPQNHIPKVGFDGLASYPFIRLLGLIGQNMKDRLDILTGTRPYDPPPVFPLLLRRRRLLSKLAAHPNIATHFNLRKAFAQGTRQKDTNARLEFIQSIYNTDYTLCIRGSANYSLRLYETMCLGRIPLFLNTDCVLPFEDKIDWKGAIAWIEESDENRIAEALLDFHQSLTPDEFKERQHYCREIWLRYLSKEGFERSLSKYLNETIHPKKQDI